jgi:NCS1 family nucleobase:cation symporter-1
MEALSNMINMLMRYLTASGFDWGMFILAIAVTFSYQISYCPISTDYARYLPDNTPKKKIWQFS